MVGAEGFEPPTLCSQSRCATRLRYAPTRFFDCIAERAQVRLARSVFNSECSGFALFRLGPLWVSRRGERAADSMLQSKGHMAAIVQRQNA